ncbi:hypothetical protein [Nucisporomicrobium flavum]|uniref:hypothetical protein n=1 Tax=Nucisporomicrobium flavum TaxID=2785915 RepID=UPI0018F544E7|nr:hypothetical protein [Nucisporomicrobium flavum]
MARITLSGKLTGLALSVVLSLPSTMMFFPAPAHAEGPASGTTEFTEEEKQQVTTDDPAVSVAFGADAVDTDNFTFATPKPTNSPA